MKSTTLPLVFLLAVLPPLQAALESVGIEVTVEPQIPAVLKMHGLRDGTGRVVVALSVSDEGRLTDTLVLEALQQELVPPALEAIKEWRFKPARYNGQAVSVTVQLAIHYSQTGVVINRTAAEMLNAYMERVVNRPDWEVCPADHLDQPLAVLKQVNPEYAVAAQREGVTGRVRIRFYVDEQGDVRMPTVSAESHPYLAERAIGALRHWKFTPPTRGGRPVLVAAVQDFAFGTSP